MSRTGVTERQSAVLTVIEDEVASGRPSPNTVELARATGYSTGEIARRMGKDPRYASVYRGRLLAAGMITTDTWGKVDYAIPYLRDYLLDHAANLVAPTGRP